MDREADVDHMPPSMLNTLSPGQSSPRLEASPLLFAPLPLFASSPPVHPARPPRRSPRPLTFYHHNRYIIPRSVFYSRVTPWNAFVRDIVRLSLLPRSLSFFPPSSSSVFFLHRLFDRRDRVVFFFSLLFFSTRRIFRDAITAPRSPEIIARAVELGYVRGDNNGVLYRLALLTHGSRKVHQFSGKLNR